MKRIFFILGFLSIMAGTAFANEIKVSNTILRAFASTFTTARDVKWSQAEGFLIAEFISEEGKQYAYYNQAGELVVVAQAIEISELSAGQQKHLRNMAQGYHITALYKMNGNEEIRYFAVLETPEKKVIVSTTGKRWQVNSTTAK